MRHLLVSNLFAQGSVNLWRYTKYKKYYLRFHKVNREDRNHKMLCLYDWYSL